MVIFITSCSPTNKEVYLSDASYCEQDSDCVSENSCRPTACVNKYFAEQNPVTNACCECEYCEVCISCDECVNNKCKTDIVGDCC